MDHTLFPPFQLPHELVENLRTQNPWWQGRPIGRLPDFKRWPFPKILARLELPLAPVLVVRGPRQIGKTTLQLQVIEDLLARGTAPKRILRVQFDDLPSLKLQEPILRIVEWFEMAILEEPLNATARRDEPCYLFFDEVQNLPSWDAQLKSLADHKSARFVVTGSSALRIERGRDSLAGRIQTLEVGPLRLAEIAGIRAAGKLEPWQQDNGWHEWMEPGFWHGLVAHGRSQAQILDTAFRAFSDRGAYPLAQAEARVPWADVAEQLNETVVRRVIVHDLRIGERGRRRDQHLLEEVFRMACRYAGQSPSESTLATEARASLQANVGPERIRHYLDFLDGSLLVRKVRPLEIRLKKKRGHAKLCLCDHALRAAWLQEIVPLHPDELDRNPHLHVLAGRIAESVVGYYLSSLTSLAVAHVPERAGQPELDFVITIGERRIPVEVKYQSRIDPLADTIGLRAFIEKAANNAAFGLLVTRDDRAPILDPRILVVPLSCLLIVR